jgi:hypothetical protein
MEGPTYRPALLSCVVVVVMEGVIATDGVILLKFLLAD